MGPSKPSGAAKPSDVLSGSASKEHVSDPRFADGAPPALPTGELPPIKRDPSRPVPRPRFKPVRLTFKVLLFAAIVYFVVLPLIPGFRSAADELTKVQPGFLVAGLVLQISAWFSYSLMTRSALGTESHVVSRFRMFRIQMSTKALSNIVPGGSAASSALGYRLLTLSGVKGPDAGFALAAAGLGSAVVLNMLFWIALLVSIPLHRGTNPLYVTAALAGVLIMLLAAFLIVGLTHGQGRAERVLRWLAAKLRFDADTAAEALRQVGTRVDDLVADRAVLSRVMLGSVCAWLLDAASLWVFLRAFGGTLDPDALLIAFGLANVAAFIPVTPGGLGIVEGVYIPTLVGLGLTRRVATLGVASYRLAQFWFPIMLGGLLYASLRVGPWSIERRERLDRLRDIANRETEDSESRIESTMRSGERDPAGGVVPGEQRDRPENQPTDGPGAPPSDRPSG
jgi:putative heme transporter